MSQQHISIALRTALWKVHSQRCVYCRAVLSFSDLHVDHVIPEKLASEPITLNKVLEDLGLPLHFDLKAPANLVPCHSRCNLQKSGDVFARPAALFFLHLAQKVEEKVKVISEALSAHSQRDTRLSSLRAALESGVLTPDDLLNRVTPVNIVFTSPLEFEDGEVREIDMAQITSLLNRTVFGEDGLPFENKERSVTYPVHNCSEYRSAIAQGFFPVYNYAIALSGKLEAIDRALAAAEASTASYASHIRSPRLGVTDLHLFPINILPTISPDEAERLEKLRAFSLADWLKKKKLTIIQLTSSSITLKWSSQGFRLTELLRTDVDGDGFEEILCEYHTWCIGGTLAHGGAIVLSRHSPVERFSFRYLGRAENNLEA